MAERERIARFFAPLAQAEPGSFALTDDAATLAPPAGHSLVVTTDSVIGGIHVLPGATAAQFAQKLVRRNLSDLAAMGATPWRYFLNLHTPRDTPDAWFAEFTAMLAQEQTQFGMVLAGGDSTSGGDIIHATMTCLGLSGTTQLLRSKATVGDDVYVSGTIGDAALGLQLLQHALATDAAGEAFLSQRYHIPEPRLELSGMLHGIAHAVIDVSDGLLADAEQIARSSSVQVRLTRASVPLSNAARALVQQDETYWQHILGGGDDYELLFAAPVAQRAALAELPVTRIGEVVAGEGVMLDGSPASGGWEH